MSLCIDQRVDCRLIWVAVILLGAVGSPTGANSCHEVRTAYMMRQIGPLKWVPDSPGPGESLQVCHHSGPSCCNAKMEESYLAAVRSEMRQKIRSYSFELKYLIAGQTGAFQEKFESLLSLSLNVTVALFDSAYAPLAAESRPLVERLFHDLSLYLAGDPHTSLPRALHRFHDDLFPLVYHRLLNPGIGRQRGDPPASSTSPTNRNECLRMTRQDVNPFGPQPRLLAESLSRALGAGRALSLLLRLAGEVLNATERAGLSRDCGRSLVRMQYCSHCRGLTLIRPCTGLCVNVMRGCLVGLSELSSPWRRLVVLLQRQAERLATGDHLELALLAIRNHGNDAVLHAQLHGPRITATVEKVCGPQPDSPMMPTAQSSFPLKGSRKDKPRSLKKLSRAFQGSVQRYLSLFSELPGMLCESEMEVEQHTCWSGEDVVESYVGAVVDAGLPAQRHNPEMRVGPVDPLLKGAMERLERLTQVAVRNSAHNLKSHPSTLTLNLASLLLSTLVLSPRQPL
ncbi:glypican-5-like [Aplochiton taeniatus]